MGIGRRRRGADRTHSQRPVAAGRIVAGGACLGLLLLSSPACGDDTSYYPRTTYGEVGILDMPSAHMAPDGQISSTIGLLNSTQRYNFAFQVLPWLEGSFRYSRLGHLRGTNPIYDRSFGLKIRLVSEDEDWPDISLGIRDILGTGVYGAEYIAASKHVGDFDVTAGLGWGRMASVDTFPNPLGLIFNSFKTRAPFTGAGGTVNFGQFFHGPSTGLFGGVVWHSPIDNLDVLAEYSTDRYVQEVASHSFKVRMPVNMGLSYRLYDAATVSAGWYYGSSYGLTLTFDADPTVPMSTQHIGPDVVRPVIRPVEQQVDALNLLLTRAKPAAIGGHPTPWVQVPDPDTATRVLSSALMSVGSGVRDVDVSGHTLLIDATLSPSGAQCERYAQIVSSLAPSLQSVAISDFNDRSGRVAICGISHSTGLVEVDGSGSETSARGGAETPIDLGAAEKRIYDDLASQKIDVEALAIDNNGVWLYYSNRRYRSEDEAVGRIARVLMADAPPSAEIFHVISAKDGMVTRDFRIARSSLERANFANATAQELGDAVAPEPAQLANPVLDRAWGKSYPRLHWSFGPGLRTGFFDPKVPLQLQILAAANASIDVTPHLTLEGRIEANIYNNFDVNVPSESVLPHVRSDLNLYYKDGANGISNLDAKYRMRLARDIFFEAKVGYLEDMFAGGGAQVLWRPDGSRFAFGANLYEVWQRAFNRQFGVQNYHVLTGHASVYYQSPWYGLNFQVHAGRYLAGDYGATFEITREFSTGVEIGAFATFTNVPFSKFGEGSFDKGIVVHIPLDWVLPFDSEAAYDLNLRSIVRDGGQRLDDDDSLFAETAPFGYGEVLRHTDDIVDP